MTEPRLEGAEPSQTIYVPAWMAARDRLVWIEDEDARALLASAMDQVERGWEAVRAVQRLADKHPEVERADNDYGALLTFAEAELRELYQSIALDLAEWVHAWPGRELPPHNDVDACLSQFGRYASVLVLATAAGVGIPRRFRSVVRHQVAPLRPGGSWFLQLASTFAAIRDVSEAEITAVDARKAVDLLMRALPDTERDHRCGLLVLDVEAEYAAAGQASPQWLSVLKSYYTAQHLVQL